jgi:hypothetical protein
MSTGIHPRTPSLGEGDPPPPPDARASTPAPTCPPYMRGLGDASLAIRPHPVVQRLNKRYKPFFVNPQSNQIRRLPSVRCVARRHLACARLRGLSCRPDAGSSAGPRRDRNAKATGSAPQTMAWLADHGVALDHADQGMACN